MPTELSTPYIVPMLQIAQADPNTKFPGVQMWTDDQFTHLACDPHRYPMTLSDLRMVRDLLHQQGKGPFAVSIGVVGRYTWGHLHQALGPRVLVACLELQGTWCEPDSSLYPDPDVMWQISAPPYLAFQGSGTSSAEFDCQSIGFSGLVSFKVAHCRVMNIHWMLLYAPDLTTIEIQNCSFDADALEPLANRNRHTSCGIKLRVHGPFPLFGPGTINRLFTSGCLQELAWTSETCRYGLRECASERMAATLQMDGVCPGLHINLTYNNERQVACLILSLHTGSNLLPLDGKRDVCN